MGQVSLGCPTPRLSGEGRRNAQRGAELEIPTYPRLRRPGKQLPKDLLLAIEAKASRGEPGPVHTLRRIVSELKIPGTQKDTRRLCLIVNRGREVVRIEPGVWSVPFERLFSPV